MTTASETVTANTLPPQRAGLDLDTVRRNVKRMLPCELEDHEMLEIARAKSKKESIISELQADLVDERKRRQSQIDEVEKEVVQMGYELITGKQQRPVLVNEVFRAGMVHVIRQDTYDEVEKRPATASEAQRFLPAVEGSGGGVLDDARAAQAGSHGEGEAPANGKPRKGKAK